jgi:restriction endonuclease Mrr
MSIPDYQTLMRPLLELLADVEEHAHRARKGVFITTVNVQ